MAVSPKQAAIRALIGVGVVALGVALYVLGFVFGCIIGWMAVMGGPN